MNVHRGKTQLLASGLNAPTGIAVDAHNRVYVAELFGPVVSVINNGRTSVVLPAMMAADVAISAKTLLAATEALAETGGSCGDAADAATLRMR